jgi:hypothetical protein
LNRDYAEWQAKCYRGEIDPMMKGYPVGHEGREVVKRMGGSFELGPEGYYDTLSIPFENGTIFIKRPWINPENGKIRRPYTVEFEGEQLPEGIEDRILSLVKNELIPQIKLKSERWARKFHSRPIIPCLKNLFK